MAKKPTKATRPRQRAKKTIPDESFFVRGEPIIGSRQLPASLVLAFADLPPELWPTPTPAELASVAAFLGPGEPEQRASRAVALVWQCALAQRQATEDVQSRKNSRQREKAKRADLHKLLGMEPEDFPCSHEKFLSRLKLGPIQLTRGKPVEGHSLWLEFLRHQMGVELQLSSVAWRESGELHLASLTDAKKRDADLAQDGWQVADVAIYIARRFYFWRKEMTGRFRPKFPNGKRNPKAKNSPAGKSFLK